jgi:hypothetical protein
MVHHRYKQVRDLLKQIASLPPDEAEEQYGFITLTNGRVRDPLDHVTYDSLEEWAESQFGESGEDIDHPQHYQ